MAVEQQVAVKGSAMPGTVDDTIVAAFWTGMGYTPLNDRLDLLANAGLELSAAHQAEAKRRIEVALKIGLALAAEAPEFPAEIVEMARAIVMAKTPAAREAAVAKLEAWRVGGQIGDTEPLFQMRSTMSYHNPGKPDPKAPIMVTRHYPITLGDPVRKMAAGLVSACLYPTSSGVCSHVLEMARGLRLLLEKQAREAGRRDAHSGSREAHVAVMLRTMFKLAA